jgi:hypothetical protein
MVDSKIAFSFHCISKYDSKSDKKQIKENKLNM